MNPTCFRLGCSFPDPYPHLPFIHLDTQGFFVFYLQTHQQLLATQYLLS